MKTSELTGAALDWAVAKCEFSGCEWWDGTLSAADAACDMEGGLYRPSSDWSQGGAVIEREKIDVWYRCGVQVIASINGQYEQTFRHNHAGHPVLIPAMRCYVASKLGDEVDVPEGLK